MKKFTFKGVLDGFRSSTVQQPPRGAEQEIQETLRADHFQLKKTFRHGFPFSPTAVAWDPIQKLLAIGDKSGSLRILGRPGVDAHVRHEWSGGIGGSEAVMHIQFLVNEGALVTATADDVLHLWNFRQKSPQVVQSLKFQRERITCLHLPLQSKWLHVGTERGNTYAVHIETFVLSAYVINWNKAIEPSRSTHPGPVVQITDNPLDASKLLIAFETGQMVVWDLRSKCADYRCIGAESLRSVAWHHEGKQFMSSHGDGSLATWAMRGPPKPLVVSYPHAKANKDGKIETCKPIQKVEWKTNKAGETLVIFSGGLPADKTGKTPSITVINGKSTTVLEIEHSVVDFITLCESPWTGDYQDPFAIVVLLQNDLVVIDLLTQGYPCFENPYPMDIHESPVTCCSYLADCPSDLIPAFYSVGRQCSQKKAGFSEREWPINGGEWSPASCSYNEIILTGHADGSVKFWDASAGTLQILYKLKTSKVFERRPGVDTSMDDSPLSVQLLSLCAESRRLAVACTASHVTLFKFRKADTTSETHVLDVPVISQDDSDNSPDSEYPPASRGSISSRAMGCQDSVDSQDRRYLSSGDLRVRGSQGTGGVRKAAGFQAALVCLQQSPASAGNISALTINSSYGLMAYGGERGIIVVDISRRVIIAALSPAALYGGADPFGRSGTVAGGGGASGGPPGGGGARRDTDASQHQRSPSIDQLEEALAELTGVPESSPVPLSSGCQTATASQEITPTNQDPNLEIADEAYLSLTPKADISNAITIPQRDMSSHSPQHVGSLPTSSLFTNDSLSLSSEERSKIEAAQHRRKSTTWKGIKRQLSRVDIKFKTPFSAAPEKKDSDGKDVKNKTSVFYCPSSDVAPPSPGEAENTNDGMKQLTQDKLETEIATSNSDTDKLSKTQDSSLEEIDKITELPDKPKLDPYDRMHQELREVWKEDLLDSKPGSDVEQASCSPSKSELKKDRRVTISVLDGACISRPDNLPLFDDDGRPIRPPRQQRKNKTSLVEKRDQRLLSVPNINTKQENVLKDLRKKETTSQLQTSFAANIMQRFSRVDKLDSSFSRSRSSSMSSLENISSEAIQCLAFADSYTKKTDPTLLLPTLWIGTSLGSVLTMMINLPEADSRYTQPVVVSVSGGPIFRLKGSILTMSFLDCNGALIPYSYESWKDENKDVRDRRDRTPTKQSSSSRMSPTLSGDASTGQSTASVGCSDRQFVVIASEKQARVVALPSQNCVYRQQIADADFVVKAEIVSLKDSVCLVNYVSTGHLIAYSLPSLRPLIDVDFLPLAELRIARTFCFSNRGHGLYLSSPTELQKFTIDVEFCQSLGEMMGELFLPRDMPEPPKESFFQSLFGGGTRPLDREELFGESIGKPPKSIAKHVPPGGSAAMEQLGTRASTASSEVQRAHQMVMERGDKLSQLEERTERMHSQAQEFGSSAHQLMLKYKDKKWYQL